MSPQLTARLTPLLCVLLWCTPAWAAGGSTKGALNILFLIGLIIALVTFLTQIVLSLVEVSSPSQMVKSAKKLACISNIFFGVIFSLYLIIAREGLKSFDSFVVTAFFGLGLSFVGVFGLLRKPKHERA